jgi:hypothetical protein
MDASIEQLKYQIYLLKDGVRCARIPCNFLIGGITQHILAYWADKNQTIPFYDQIEIVNYRNSTISKFSTSDTNSLNFIP